MHNRKLFVWNGTNYSAGDYWKNTMAADTSSSFRGEKARAKNEK
jgi:hypothetical protein